MNNGFGLVVTAMAQAADAARGRYPADGSSASGIGSVSLS